MSNTAEAYKHCESLVREQDKDRFLSGLFAPADRRPFLYAVYAFDIETSRVRHLVSEPIAGEIRLQWWHDALSGLRSEEAAASPVMIALSDACARIGTNIQLLVKAIEARQNELHGEPAVEAASAVLLVSAFVLGAGGHGIVGAAPDGGKAMALSRDPQHADAAREAYRAFRNKVRSLRDNALPAFLPVALVPLRLRHPQASPWRRQIALARAAWFGFPRI